MISGILGAQAVNNNPILRPPSALTASTSIATGTGSPTTIAGWLGTAADVSSTQTTTSNVDLVNVTGKGVCLFCAFYVGNTANACVGTITIDGTIVYNAGSTGTTAKLRTPVGCVSALDTASGRATISFEAVPFNVSLRIQYRSDTAALAVGAAAKYRLAD